jgi:dTDP-4-dehydrorhamnose reductase
VHTCLDLLIDGETGIWHLSSGEALSWAQLAARAAGLAGLETALLCPCPATALDMGAPQPRFSALGSERGQLLPTLDDALRRYLDATADQRRQAVDAGAGRARQRLL